MDEPTSPEPTIKVQKPATLAAIRSPAFMYSAMYSSGGTRSVFIESEYDLSEIGRIQDTESYVAQAFQKRIGLMFKEGYEFVSSNMDANKYIHRRFEQIGQVSGVSLDRLIRSIGAELVQKANCFVVKVRKESASGGKRRILPGGKSVEPVAAYFVVPAETMRYRLDTSGTRIIKWEHRLNGRLVTEFDPADVVHFFCNKKEGFVFGTPMLVPVIDDIRALRKIEENIELLVYQHLFPLFHYTVGTESAPAGTTESGESEIDVVRNWIRLMPSEGGIVTPERHDIKLIGSEGRAIRAEGYLEHFKQRVFAGLGMSSVDMGDGQTANRSTADSMSRNLVDSVKDIQQVLEGFFNVLIIRELLMESDFDDFDIFESENQVFLRFKEVDFDAEIKKNNAVADLFQKNAITFDEARMEMGRKVIGIPRRDEAIDSKLDLSAKYPEWFRTFWKLFEEPKALIQALDEPWGVEARAIANNASTSMGENEVEAASVSQPEVQNKPEAESKPMTQAQRVMQVKKQKTQNPKDSKFAQACRDLSRASPRPEISITRAQFDQAEDFTVASIAAGSDPDWVCSQIRTILGTAKLSLASQMVGSFSSGYRRVSSDVYKYNQAYGKIRGTIQIRADAYIHRLEEDLIHHVTRSIQTGDQLGLSDSDIANRVKVIFESLRYRANQIDKSELFWSFTIGKLRAMEDSSVKSFIIHSEPRACSQCLGHDGQVVEIQGLGKYDIPPFHPHCECSIEAKR